jgi:hypothetical protein
MGGWGPCLAGITIGLGGIGIKVLVAHARGRTVSLRRPR